MQRLTIIGHIGQDSVVKDLGSNQVINFSVAVSETYVNKTTNEKITNTTWYECAKWGNNTSIAQYLKKGQQVFIEGKPSARAWQKEDGSLVSVLGINVFDITLLGSSKSEGNSTAQQQPPQSNNATEEFKPITAVKEDEDDGLPF
jgi:single-strand DNA-binding protein